jgi:hypothetical protein
MPSRKVVEIKVRLTWSWGWRLAKAIMRAPMFLVGAVATSVVWWIALLCFPCEH